MKLSNVQPRRDGKFSVVISFDGARNAFGGFYPDKTFRKVVDQTGLEKYRKLAQESENLL